MTLNVVPTPTPAHQLQRGVNGRKSCASFGVQLDDSGGYDVVVAVVTPPATMSGRLRGDDVPPTKRKRCPNETPPPMNRYPQRYATRLGSTSAAVSPYDRATMALKPTHGLRPFNDR